MKEWNPVFTREQIEQAKRNGVSYLTLYARVKYYGWDIDKAINTPPHKRFGNDVKSILPEEAVKIAEQNGLSRVDIWNRLNAGWTLERAVHTPKTRRKLHIPAEALEIAKNNGIARRHIVMRLRMGWKLDEAITKPIRKKKRREGKVS